MVPDSTTRQQMEEALLESQQRLRALFDNVLDAIFIVNDEARYVDANLAACSLLGYSREELLQLSVWDVMHMPKRELGLELWRAFLDAGQQSGECTLSRKDQSHIEADYRAAANIVPGLHLSIVRDITERKRAEEALRQAYRDLESRVEQRTAELMAANALLKEKIIERQRAEEALRESESRYRAIVDDQTELICRFSPDGTLTFVNEAYCRFFGKGRDDLIGHNFLAFIAESEHPKIIEHLARFSVDKPTATMEHRVTLPGNEISWQQWTNRAIFDETGHFIEFQSVGRDITERKQAEEERTQLMRRLVTAQENERRRIARELHDQMGQQLTALMLSLQSLKDSSQLPSPASERLQQSMRLADQLGQEVHTLAWELRPTALDDWGLHTALSNYLEEWSERCGIAVDFHSNGLIQQRLPSHVETTVYRIVQEALTNVLKHAAARRVSLLLENRQGRLLVIVEDDGRGFNVEALMNESDSSRRLGLIGMQERVTLVGGTLNIESTPGAGTTVFVHIPQLPNEAGVRTHE